MTHIFAQKKKFLRLEMFNYFYIAPRVDTHFDNH